MTISAGLIEVLLCQQLCLMAECGEKWIKAFSLGLPATGWWVSWVGSPWEQVEGYEPLLWPPTGQAQAVGNRTENNICFERGL